FLAVYIAWTRREEFSRCRIRPSFLWGMAALLVALGLRVFGLYFLYGSAERLSLIVCLVGIILLLFGWSFFRKSITILLFLCLMLPLPRRVEAVITIPLQSWATSSAVFCLETLGYEIIREGNIIHLGDTTVAVAEACNGLRMITAFFVIIGLVALLVKRQWWEKFILVLSALPIALLCNTIRLAITSIAFTKLEGEFWEKAFHDFGGYAMMPLALAMVVLELLILTKLTTVPDEDEKEEILITRSGG
ncbi:MAG: exosortase/archaeosortase family protein, partial [Desulfosporosinus sp.]|nr:exosortase/archaeosortase family protein [Desulfosporosinus sp.]